MTSVWTRTLTDMFPRNLMFVTIWFWKYLREPIYGRTCCVSPSLEKFKKNRPKPMVHSLPIVRNSYRLQDVQDSRIRNELKFTGSEAIHKGGKLEQIGRAVKSRRSTKKRKRESHLSVAKTSSLRQVLYSFSTLWEKCCTWPRWSMYGIFTYIWVIYGVNVGKYIIHGSSGWMYIFVVSPFRGFHGHGGPRKKPLHGLCPADAFPRGST